MEFCVNGHGYCVRGSVSICDCHDLTMAPLDTQQRLSQCGIVSISCGSVSFIAREDISSDIAKLILVEWKPRGVDRHGINVTDNIFQAACPNLIQLGELCAR